MQNYKRKRNHREGEWNMKTTSFKEYRKIQREEMRTKAIDLLVLEKFQLEVLLKYQILPEDQYVQEEINKAKKDLKDLERALKILMGG